MRHLSIALCLGLLACGPALEDLPNIQDVDVDPDAEAARSLATTASPEADGGLLSALFSRPGEQGEKETASDQRSVATPPAGEPASEGLAGLFRAAMPAASGAAGGADIAPEVARGTLLPYGALARVCNLRRADLGKEVDRYPERGRGYRLYDTNPSSTGLRTHYVTGFDDNCARQFTAALALFGTTETHEAVRYDRSNKDLPFTETDNAYETLKTRVCRVGKGKPCSERRRSALDKSTVFVSVYERFLGNPRWADMLLHDGKVLAKDLKER